MLVPAVLGTCTNAALRSKYAGTLPSLSQGTTSPALVERRVDALVVSFCNCSGVDHAMLAVRTPSGDWYPMRGPGSDPVSACGLAADAANVYCAYTQSGASFLAVCDIRANRIVESMPLASVRDVHSVVFEGGALIVASTGNDSIVRVRLSDGAGEVLWRANSGGTDTHHVNGLHVYDGRVLCTAFGPRLGPSWADAVDGYVYDLTTGAYLMRGIYQPHSLASNGAELYFCESARGAIRSLRGDVQYVAGYARGLAFTGDGAYAAGCSVARRADGVPGAAFGNPAEAGARSGVCAVYFGSLVECAISRERLDHLGSEIYDVLAFG